MISLVWKRISKPLIRGNVYVYNTSGRGGDSRWMVAAAMASTSLFGFSVATKTKRNHSEDQDCHVNYQNDKWSNPLSLGATTICHCQQQPPAVVPQRENPSSSVSSQEKNDKNRLSEDSNNATTTMATSNAPSFHLEEVYELLGVLGEGGYGIVYQARRKRDGLSVALKTMPREFTGQTDFEKEVAALTRIADFQAQESETAAHQQQQHNSRQQHSPHNFSHIVQLYDLHRDNDNYYLAMELVEGGELLEHLIEHGAYSEGEAALYLRQLAEALVVVHRAGLIHADLKPENLLLSTRPSSTNNESQLQEQEQQPHQQARLKLADFGCATRHHESDHEHLRLPAEEFALGCRFLHLVALGNPFELEQLLQEHGTSLVRFQDYDWRTPLHLAASEGHVDICRYLVERGADMNARDRWGGTPLSDAHRHGHTDVIRYLVKQGAALGGQQDATAKFIAAASQGDKDQVQAWLALLDSPNGNVDNDKSSFLNQGDYDHRRALHLAAGEGRIKIVQMLCEAGADVNAEDRWKNRPLDDAQRASKNSSRIVQLLKDYGATSGTKSQSLGSSFWPSFSSKKALQTKGTDNPAPQVESVQEHGVSGTVAYWPPELFVKGATPTPATDLWAAGVILYVLLTGSHPFDKNGDQTDEEIKQSLIQLNCENENCMELLDERVFDDRVESLSDSCVELMRHLMHPNPKKRIDSQGLLRHPWTQGLTASWTTMSNTHNELKAFWQKKFRAEILQKFARSLGITNDQPTEQELTKMFQALDLKQNGVLELDEIRTFFRDRELGDKKNIETAFFCADLDGSGVIRFDEFRALMTNKSNLGDGPGLNVHYLQNRFRSNILSRFSGANKKSKTKDAAPLDKSALREIFNAIDLEGNGVLDSHEIRVILRSAGESEDVISRMIASLDLDRDGRVSWDEFLALMNSKDE